VWWHEQGPENVTTWEGVVRDLQKALVKNQDLQVDAYQCPLAAFQLSVQSMGEQELQLLSVLRNFPPVEEVATEAVKAFWQEVWAPSDPSCEQFEDAQAEAYEHY
jgi:hypothetical protein